MSSSFSRVSDQLLCATMSLALVRWRSARIMHVRWTAQDSAVPYALSGAEVDRWANTPAMS